MDVLPDFPAARPDAAAPRFVPVEVVLARCCFAVEAVPDVDRLAAAFAAGCFFDAGADFFAGDFAAAVLPAVFLAVVERPARTGEAAPRRAEADADFFAGDLAAAVLPAVFAAVFPAVFCVALPAPVFPVLVEFPRPVEAAAFRPLPPRAVVLAALPPRPAPEPLAIDVRFDAVVEPEPRESTLPVRLPDGFAPVERAPTLVCFLAEVFFAAPAAARPPPAAFPEAPPRDVVDLVRDVVVAMRRAPSMTRIRFPRPEDYAAFIASA